MSEPVIKLDTNGQASVISYNVPEPTSYSGENVVEFSFPSNYFKSAAKKIPADRLVETSDAELELALENLTNRGFVDSRVFPNAKVSSGGRSLSSNKLLATRK